MIKLRAKNERKFGKNKLGEIVQDYKVYELVFLSFSALDIALYTLNTCLTNNFRIIHRYIYISNKLTLHVERWIIEWQVMCVDTSIISIESPNRNSSLQCQITKCIVDDICCTVNMWYTTDSERNRKTTKNILVTNIYSTHSKIMKTNFV